MFSLDGQVIIVTGGAGHLGSAICQGIRDMEGHAIPVSRSVPVYSSDAYNVGFNKTVLDIVQDYGRLDALVNIVGDVEICTEAVKDHVKVIVNCASLWGTLAPNPSMYLDLGNEPSPSIVAEKGRILALTRYYASFLAPIRVNSFSPGWFPKKRGPDRPDYIEEITSRTPLKRIGVPEDIVGTVLFLLSDASKFMTGQNLVVDGGYSIW